MNKLTTIFGGLTVLATLAGVFMLAWHGDIPGSAAVAVGTAALSSAGGALAVHAGAKLGLGSSNNTPEPVAAPVAPAEPAAAAS